MAWSRTRRRSRTLTNHSAVTTPARIVIPPTTPAKTKSHSPAPTVTWTFDARCEVLKKGRVKGDVVRNMALFLLVGAILAPAGIMAYDLPFGSAGIVASVQLIGSSYTRVAVWCVTRRRSYQLSSPIGRLGSGNSGQNNEEPLLIEGKLL